MYKKRYLIMGLFIFSLFLFSNKALAISLQPTSVIYNENNVIGVCDNENNFVSGIYDGLVGGITPCSELSNPASYLICVNGFQASFCGSTWQDFSNNNLTFIETNNETGCDGLTLSECENSQYFVGKTILTVLAPNSQSLSATGTLATIGAVIVNVSIETGSNIFTTYWPYFLIFTILLALALWGKRIIKLGRK